MNEIKELTELLERMNVPKLRLKDFRWLLRNLGVQNCQHPDFPRAKKLIVEQVRQMDRKNKTVYWETATRFISY